MDDLLSLSQERKNNRKKEVEKRIGALRRLTGQTQVLSPYAARPTAHRASRCTCSLDGPYASDGKMRLEGLREPSTAARTADCILHAERLKAESQWASASVSTQQKTLAEGTKSNLKIRQTLILSDAQVTPLLIR